jgi:hypothetical protein
MDRDDKFFFFPEPFVYHYTVPEHTLIKQELQPKLEFFYQQYSQEEKYRWSNDSLMTSKMCSNFNQASIQKNWYTQEHLQAIVWNSLDELLTKLGKKTSKCKLTTFWWNVYQKGDSAPIHNHGSFGISGVYLLHLTEPNKTAFVHNTRALLKNEQDLIYYETPDVQEGTVLLFPSALNHYVDPAETTRMSISFNVLLD